MKNFLIISLLLFLVACGSDTLTEPPESNSSVRQIIFSKEQLKLAGIKTAMVEEITISQQIFCTGRIKASPQNRAKISVPMEGYILNINIRKGQTVDKNTALVSLQHPVYIEIQKNYLQTKTRLNFLHKEYERQKTLKEHNAGTGKYYEKSEAEYENLKIELEALKLELEMISINAEQINADNIKKSINVIAPIGGVINEMNITIGQYVRPDEILMEIVNNKDFQIELQVFEKDINKIEVGQNVLIDCNMPESYGSIHSGRVTHIGNYVDDISKTFMVIAKPEESYPRMRHGIFLNARIMLSNNKLPALPEEAVENDGERQFVFIASSDTSFIQQYVETGINANGYFSITEPDLGNKIIVVSGANYLKAELKSE